MVRITIKYTKKDTKGGYKVYFSFNLMIHTSAGFKSI